MTSSSLTVSLTCTKLVSRCYNAKWQCIHLRKQCCFIAYQPELILVDLHIQHDVLTDFSCPFPSRGLRVTDFSFWEAHEALLFY